jgi:hypothetical protein
MHDLQGNAANTAVGVNTIAEIVERKSGGFRLILRIFGVSGVSVVEPCATIFERLGDAEDYAARLCGVGSEQARCG